MKRSIGVTVLLIALGLASGVSGLSGCASGTQGAPGSSSGAPGAPAGGGSY